MLRGNEFVFSFLLSMTIHVGALFSEMLTETSPLAEMHEDFVKVGSTIRVNFLPTKKVSTQFFAQDKPLLTPNKEQKNKEHAILKTNTVKKVKKLPPNNSINEPNITNSKDDKTPLKQDQGSEFNISNNNSSESKVVGPKLAKSSLAKYSLGKSSITKPAYPRMSRKLGEEGTVVLNAFISQEGLLKKVVVDSSSGFSRLDKAAISALKEAIFIPATRDGIAIPSSKVFHFTFTLH